ncbi:hypothetical protein DFP72DRAFT_931052 [Ephemerocybe angulata]|uniref:DUF6533 domain-containing protein n=1 Tax=Ephemerocybe angulata TaxID=980116 RepID=A0A8H6HCX4_9AGAR|nr:hypothetical protein DFP72DRAFT_931052 [Tulosesus angulatus]
MSLSPEDVADLTEEISIWYMQDYIQLGFWTLYLYHYPTTLVEEVSTIWPQKWRTGKILFFLLRYTPILYLVLRILTDLRTHIDLTPKVCQGMAVACAFVIGRVTIYGAEVVILLCLHALLGARRRYLALMILIYTGSTIAAIILSSRWDSEGSRTIPRSKLDQELGYGCTWAGAPSSDAIKLGTIAGYINLGKVTSVAILMLSVFLVRYRSTTGTLLHVLRRDSGVHIFSLTALRLTSAVIGNLQESLGFYNIPTAILNSGQYAVIPILACRLLLNMRKSEDPGVQKTVSSLLFGAPVPADDSEDDDDDEPTGISLGPVRRYAGLGRQGDAKGGMARRDAEAKVGAVPVAEENGGSVRPTASQSAGD